MVSIDLRLQRRPQVGRRHDGHVLEYTVTESPRGRTAAWRARRADGGHRPSRGRRRVPLDGHAGERAVEVEDAHRRGRTRPHGHGDELTHAPDTTGSAARLTDGRIASSRVCGLGVVGHVERGPERAAPDEHVHLRLDHREARLHQLGVEGGVLAGRRGDVPPVDEHVEEAVPAVDRARAPGRTTPRTASPSPPARGTPRRRPATSRRRRAAGRCRARRRRAGRPPPRW